MIKNPLKYFLTKKLSQFYTVVSVYVTDNNTNKIVKQYKQIGKSFTSNYLAILYHTAHNWANIAGYPNVSPFSSYNSFIDINSVNSPSNTPLYHHGAINNHNSGIVIGTGTQSINPLTPSLNSIITNGTGVGQMTYQAQLSTTGLIRVANETSFTLQRTFINSSGATIIVSEVAIYSHPLTPIYCIYIDNVVPTPVNTSQSITVEIKVSLNT